jgi:hypothetical protein
MFRRPNVVVVNQPPRTEYVTRDVHEHRAPTDDSVKLLREMEEKAKDQVIQAVHVGDTTFECVVHMQKHPMDGSTSLLAVFSLNGKKMTAEFREQDWRSDKFKLVDGLRAALADKISREVLIPALERFDCRL